MGVIARTEHVTLRRGIRYSEGYTAYICPDVRVYRCVTSIRVAI